MLPVVAMWGQRWGLLITATTAMPDAVRTGFARSLQGGWSVHVFADQSMNIAKAQTSRPKCARQ